MRFDAKRRHYIYKIVNRNASLALDVNRALHVSYPIDVENMKKAATVLIGSHDFSSFRSVQCQATSPIKTLDKIDLSINDNADDSRTIFITFTAKSFLHNMVRNIVGSLLEVGLRKKDAEWLDNVLKQRNRNLAGPTAPACGLYFLKADYD